MIRVYNYDCIDGAKKFLKCEEIDLLICDPPFSIHEQKDKFQNQYNRNSNNIIKGYVPAPADYAAFSFQWIEQAKRVLKNSGSMYIVSGHTHLIDILSAIEKLDLHLINHIIWKFNFGVFTRRKFVTSHYHILFLNKSKNIRPVFNQRFNLSERTKEGRSLQYMDTEDVWIINKEFQAGKIKNCNKLPDSLVRKMIQISSNPKDKVCDFFLGNFTTARIARQLGRQVCGFELNKNAFDYWMPLLKKVKFGDVLNETWTLYLTDLNSSA